MDGKDFGIASALNVLASAAYEGNGGSVMTVLIMAAWITGQHAIPKDPEMSKQDLFVALAKRIVGQDAPEERQPIMKAIRYFTAALREIDIMPERIDGFRLPDQSFDALAKALEEETGAIPGSLRAVSTLEIGGLLFQRPIVPTATAPGSRRVN